MLGLQCCARSFSSCSEQGHALAVVHGLRIVEASLGGDHGLWPRGLWRWQHIGSVVVPGRLRCSTTCGISLDQGSFLYLPHWQLGSQPLVHQGSSGM